jgi:serine/threonine protein kinase
MKQRYEIIEKIGEGKFGNVYRGTYIKAFIGKLREPVAIKVGETLNQLKILKNETTVLHYLHSNGCRQIPHIIWYGRLDPIGSMGFIMPLYECSLSEYSKKKEFTTAIVQSIMIQAISILESIHKHFVIHRDIKPQNFMIKDGELYLIDFGFATFYVNADKEHISIDRNQESILGTPKYISIYNHMGISNSRRDDMISLGYIMFFLLYPREPDEKMLENHGGYDRSHILHPMNQILKKEKEIGVIENLCKNDHPEIYYYLKTCYEIEYHEAPDYEFLRETYGF